jgi:hypothetical protein
LISAVELDCMRCCLACSMFHLQSFICNNIVHYRFFCLIFCSAAITSSRFCSATNLSHCLTCFHRVSCSYCFHASAALCVDGQQPLYAAEVLMLLHAATPIA